MEWSNSKPTVPGWYWWRQGDCDCYAAQIVQVDLMFGGWHTYFMDGSSKPLADLSGQWAGPITEPKEA